MGEPMPIVLSPAQSRTIRRLAQELRDKGVARDRYRGLGHGSFNVDGAILLWVESSFIEKRRRGYRTLGAPQLRDAFRKFKAHSSDSFPPGLTKDQWSDVMSSFDN